ncbi:minor tail protein [Gordonia phage Tardus]|uniref:Minor tail protein n=1 Tax=Gordonia phage Tardus TaxID=2939734 RepID=A0A9E7E508_9CAUD|nr:minor tail protein [Gordonia phage Tardus]
MAPLLGSVLDDRRSASLILRDRHQLNDLIVVDVLASDTPRGRQGVTLGGNLSGLWKVPTETPLEQWAYQEGATPSQFPRKKERRPTAEFITYASTFAEYQQIESLLWSVLDTKWDCWLRIYFPPPHGWRELRVRLLNEPDDKSNEIPGRRLNRVWPVQLLACDPFWYSEPYQYEFVRDNQGDGRPYMTPVGGGAYEIMVPWSNPTDEHGWAEWNSGELTGTAETWSFPDGDSGNLIALPSLSGANKSFWVQTNPSKPQLWVRDVAQDWARMKAKTFTKPLLANTPDVRTVKVRLQGGTPTSSMMLTIPRRWDRPIGGQLPIVREAVLA